MKLNKTPEQIWNEYQKGIDYNSSISLYDQVEQNQNFYNGKQWEGVSAPNIEKPVVNMLRPAVDFFISMLVSDDIAVSCEFPNEIGKDELTKQAIESIVTKGIDDVFEQTQYKSKLRTFVRDSAVNGKAYKHWWFNTKKNNNSDEENDDTNEFIGAIDVEIIDCTNVIFGNPASTNIDSQPYILIASKVLTETVKEMVSKEQQDEVKSDYDDPAHLETEARANKDYTTVITKMWKEKGIVHFMKTTSKVVVKKETSLNQKCYPISSMTWKTQKNSYQGISPLTEVIQNQIMVNKYFMMLNEFIKKLSFPKILYDRSKISQWSNSVEALGVNGDPREAIVSTTPVVQFSEQVLRFVDMLIAQTKTTLGITDVQLGNVNPQNTSAIIALQKTAAQPLELQRLDLYQSVEDDVKIIVDIMASYYGIRQVPFETEEGESQIDFDYSDLSYQDLGMNIEVGKSYYWDEVMAIQTLDNLYNKQIIPDAITYLEQLPNGTVRNRQEIIKAIRAKQNEEQALAQGQMQPQVNAQLVPDLTQ